MFDNIAPVRISRRRKIFFAASGVVHGAAVAALIVTAMWRVDKLAYEKEHVQVSIMPPPPPGNSGGGRKPQATKSDIKKPPPKIRVTTPVQPVPHVAVHEEATPTATVETIGDGPGGDGKGHGEPTVGTGCTDPLACGTAIAAPPEPPKPCSDPSRAADPDCAPVKPPRPPIVVIEQLRLSGRTNVQPPDDVKIMMMREGKSKLRAAFRVCLDAGGAVESTTLITSTGYDAYDGRLTEAMAGWTYRPYSVSGTAIAVCGAVSFVFTMR